jgi:hypothetical protein
MLVADMTHDMMLVMLVIMRLSSGLKPVIMLDRQKGFAALPAILLMSLLSPPLESRRVRAYLNQRNDVAVLLRKRSLNIFLDPAPRKAPLKKKGKGEHHPSVRRKSKLGLRLRSYMVTGEDRPIFMDLSSLPDIPKDRGLQRSVPTLLALPVPYNLRLPAQLLIL